MSKDFIVSFIKEQADLPTLKKAEDAYEAILDTMTRSLGEGEEVRLRGFGTFHVKHRAARTGRNPSTGQPMTIPAHDTVVFSTGKELETLAKKAQTGEAHGWLENKQFMRRAQEQLDHFSQRLTTARKSWDDGVDNLGEAYETARYKLDLLRRGGSEAWGDVRKGLENALGELRRAFGKASDRF